MSGGPSLVYFCLVEYENLMMCSCLSVHKAVAVEGFIGFFGILFELFCAVFVYGGMS